MGPVRGHPLVATQSQLEILVYTSGAAQVKFAISCLVIHLEA
jgi:tRNA threonylcarbamoyladenosine modification (KEOPS) complex Cgi121 subunit